MTKNNAIIGTAGHVDHGKTLLIKALTGMDTDRLKEEKKRGITIELGFAHLTLPNGEKAGIVDVPGHEKFVRNMLAGAGSIDLAMLVIAADEGIMPQTREHLAILGLLGIERGLIVLNKIDLVESEWLELMTLEIEEELATGFLKNAPIMPVSAHSGAGIEALRQKIFEMLADSPPKRVNAPFRMPIDRVFTMEGFGTVATGTLIEGALALGDDVEIFPGGLMAKARRIQVHGAEAGRVEAGQRVAVNLAGLKVSDLRRGDWAAAPASLINSYRLDVVVEIDKDMNREIKNNSKLHFHHGTGDVLCNLLLLDKTVLKAGQRAYGQLRLAEPVAARPGDRFVLRFYSPMETIGGGIILDPVAGRMKRHESATLERFAALEKGSLPEKIEAIFAGRSAEFPLAENIARRHFHLEAAFGEALKQLIVSGILIDLGGQIIHRVYLESLGDKAKSILKDYHKMNPLQEGMTIKDLASRILPRQPQNLAERAASAIIAAGMVKKSGQFAALNDFAVETTADHAKIKARLLEIYTSAGFAPPDKAHVAAQFATSAKERRAFEQMFAALVAAGDLVAITPQIHLHKSHYNAAFAQFADMAAKAPEVLTKDFRDALNTSRKFAMAILEYFDKAGLTKMTGEGRILLPL
ncbi:MAG: selenocysteine-specific translation elongation factor [Clostridiales bacterium]|jgi:selenocysteine-specific elongation factor|nr:selenocysteine-specific translation elongation factor [Clostridiales bacterium]